MERKLWELITSFESEHDARAFAGHEFYSGTTGLKIIKRGLNYLVYSAKFESYSIVHKVFNQ
jgi:hypothetical protein